MYCLVPSSSKSFFSRTPPIVMLRRSVRLFASVPQRNHGYKQLSQQDLTYFKSILSSSEILHESTGATADDLQVYNEDWMKKYRGHSTLVLRPQLTEQVSKILKYCNQEKLAVVPQGGNTGLVGGSVPVYDEIILSTQNMNKILDFDAISGSLICQAGCVLEKLDDYLAERDYMMPLDLGAKGSCHIGGNLATNAGGLRLLRYGSLHGSVLGIEAVLADGTILSDLKTLRKDNTGYDLKQLFIGSEGTLGIVTGVSILTPPRPNSFNVALLAVDSFDAVQKVFTESKKNLAEILSAFEFFDSDASELVRKHLDVKFPFSEKSPFYILIETAGSRKEHDDEKLSDFLEHLLETEVVSDGALAQDAAQMKSMWSIREGIPEACSKAGAVYKYDISMPLSSLYQLVEDMKHRLREKDLYRPSDLNSPVRAVIGYGHVGDGNLHLNIAANGYSDDVTNAIEPFVYEWTSRVSGSVSAEHGLGLMKRDCIGYSKPPEMIRMMKTLKATFDPSGILNPYKFLPDI